MRDMNRKDRKRMQADFFNAAGPNAATFKAMMDVLPDVAFYMKDAEGRIMALNKRNCDFCNIHDELDAVGRRSVDIFPPPLAQDFVSLDKTVLRTGRPLINQASDHNADWSSDKHVKSIFPLHDRKGRCIGTTCLYYKAASAQSSPDWHGIMKPVTDYIQANYTGDVSAGKLASMAGMPESSFRLRFTQTFGISPGRYITAIRLNAARKLLETTEKPLSEIAIEAGFWDQSHFTKMFKIERGVTPGEYRRRHRTQTET